MMNRWIVLGGLAALLVTGLAPAPAEAHGRGGGRFYRQQRTRHRIWHRRHENWPDRGKFWHRDLHSRMRRKRRNTSYYRHAGYHDYGYRRGYSRYVYCD